MRALDATLESWILSYLLNSLWQVPLIYVAAWLAARIARPAGPRVEHRIWVAALLVQVGLPACDVQLADVGQRALGFVLDLVLLSGSANGQIRVVPGAGMVSGMSGPLHIGAVFTVATIVYLTSLLYFFGRLAWGVWTTESMRRRAVSLKPDAEIVEKICLLTQSFGMKNSAVRLCASNTIPGPATVGLRPATLLLPQGFLEKLDTGEVNALLAHELAHIKRNDFAKNMIHGLVSIPVAYHPLLWLTRTRLAETRELVCDAMAAEAVGGRESYARSLLRLASMLSDRRMPGTVNAVGIFDANIFERRVMNLTRRSLDITGLRKAAIYAACTMVALGACGSALALRMDVNKPPAQGAAPSKVAVKADAMTILSKVAPIYPPDAKKNKVMGTVVVAATIGKDGAIENAEAKSGPAGLRGSAVDAVKQWKYQPFLLNGNPVEVDTKINITYSLSK